MSDFRWGLGHLSLDFVATLGARRVIRSSGWVPGGLGGMADNSRPTGGNWPLRNTHRRPSSADARQLREATYRVLMAGRLGDAPSTDDVDLINRYARGANAALQIGPGLSVVRLATDPVAVAISELARTSVELLTGAELPRVPAMRWLLFCLFLDRSRPGQRRWCSMGSCGNRSKTARYRPKHDGVTEDVVWGALIDRTNPERRQIKDTLVRPHFVVILGRSRLPFQDPHQRHDLRLLAHVKPGDGPSDDHALDLRRALENREARGGAGSFRR